MHMRLSYFDFIVGLGCINAFVFAFVLAVRFKKSIADKLLVCILIILGLLCAKILLHTLGLWQHVYLRYFPLGIDLWLAPLLWLYVLALTEPKRLVYTLFVRHMFLPALFLIYGIIVYAVTVAENNLMLKDVLAEQLLFKGIKAFEDILSLLMGVYYGVLTLQQLKKYQAWVRNYIADTAVPTYNWLRNLLLATAIVLSLLGIMLVANQFKKDALLPLQLFYYYLVFVVYVFAFFGFRHHEFKLSQDLIAKKTAVLSDSQLIDLVEKLDHWMDLTKPYLEANLNLHQCAKALACPAPLLSEAINMGKKQNFRDYINDLRVEAFKTSLLNADLKRETIMGIAYNCGFNSEASFYRIFKEKTGLTPKQFLQAKP